MRGVIFSAAAFLLSVLALVAFYLGHPEVARIFVYVACLLIILS